MAKLKITETVLRDSHQSLIATRMTIDEMLPILKALDEVGYYSLEAWGGATFDACLRFLNEDPWERLRTIRANVKNTKLQMLFRGQNILGYRHYADDVVEYFVQKSIANGIDIIRIFDALNDPRNLKTAIDATKKEGGHVQRSYREFCKLIVAEFDTVDIRHIFRNEILERNFFQLIELEVQTGQQMRVLTYQVTFFDGGHSVSL